MTLLPAREGHVLHTDPYPPGLSRLDSYGASTTGSLTLHLRTTNPIESAFSPVRARTRVTKGPGTRDTGLAMVFKLLEAAQGRWRAVNGPHLVALVRAGARFQAGKLIERPDQTPDKEADEDVTKVAA